MEDLLTGLWGWATIQGWPPINFSNRQRTGWLLILGGRLCIKGWVLNQINAVKQN